MRNLVFLLFALSVIGCAVEEVTETIDKPVETTEVVFNADHAPTVVFSVPGMMCPTGCAPKVKEALASQPGVKDVQVVYETKTATVAVDKNRFDADAAVALLKDEYGFEDTSLAEPGTDQAKEVEQAEG